MKIWIFNHYATAPNHVGGTRHYDLAAQLISRGHEVTIIASSFNHVQKQEMCAYDNQSSVKKETINGVKYLWIKTAAYSGNLKRIINILGYTKRAYQAAKRELKSDKPDIVIGSSVHPLTAYIGYLIAKKSKSHFYFEERDLWPQTFVDFGKLSENSLIAKALYKFEKFLYTKAKKIIVLFGNAPNYVTSRNIDRDKVIYLPNGVNMDNFKEPQKVPELTQTMEKYRYTVVYTGSHGLANHLEPLIETAELLQNKHGNTDIQFVLIGHGPLKEKLINLAKQYRLTNVTFLDSITKDQIPYFLSLADLSFISIKKSPLYKWGFSMNKIFDYMAAGLPIMVYSDKETAGELNSVEGAVVSETPEELADAVMQYMYSDDSGRSEALKQYVASTYSWETLAVELESHMLRDMEQGE
ncbi:glycosyltransferase family 4 protein [Virgibacillus flavescens]|uniref:glycosyltransferase family 4 protein n=1 Tax=Virgibacillus flavescens TaxID=1611422 RepID=UPI003D342B40